MHPPPREGAPNPHILNLSPPLNMEARWFAPHVAYTMAKFGMSMCVLGMAGELKPQGIAVNALWPRTVIATAAVKNLLGGDEVISGSRKPEIMADAALRDPQRPSARLHRSTSSSTTKCSRGWRQATCRNTRWCRARS